MTDITEKACATCGETKDVSEYGKRKDSKDGYRASCKQCCGAKKPSPPAKESTRPSGAKTEPTEGSADAGKEAAPKAPVKKGRPRGASQEPAPQEPATVDTGEVPATQGQGTAKDSGEADKPAAKKPAKRPALGKLSLSQGKTFFLNPDDIIVNWENNLRGLDEEHADGFAHSFAQGHHVPPVTIKATPQGVELVAGYHRFTGYLRAVEQGVELPGIECHEWKGGKDEQIAFMFRENDGKAFSGLEVADAIGKLKAFKWEVNRIAEALGKSRSYVEKYYLLFQATEPVKELVRDGSLPLSQAIEFVRKYGDEAHAAITKQLLKQKERGTKKPTAKAKPKFPAAQAQQFLDALGLAIKVDTANSTDELVVVFAEMTPHDWAQLEEVVEDYRDFRESLEDL